MGGWESLRGELRRLMEESPGALVVWPDPYSERRRGEGRIRIELAAWAVDIAGGLHARYGELVELQVGAMRFPAGELAFSRYGNRFRGEPALEAGLDVMVRSPLSVRTGWSGHGDVMVTNRGASAQVLITDGELSSAVTDSSGHVVGLFVGPRNARRVGFEIGAGQRRTVPVLIGTASMVPELGYAVPPGTWGLAIELRTESGSLLLASLELTITP